MDRGEEQGSPQEPSSSGLSKRGKDVGVLRRFLLPPLLAADWASPVFSCLLGDRAGVRDERL